MSKEKYIPYVDLMLKVLPYVANEDCFSLKGGTAINLFVRNLPRLSVDIDLSYVGLDPRKEAIQKAEAALRRIKVEIERTLPKTKVIAPTKSDSDNMGNSSLSKIIFKLKLKLIQLSEVPYLKLSAAIW
jgi:predicted nucleotidyltransferase component of viral defense system